MGKKWFVSRTEPRSEYVSAAELEKDGYEIFFPRVTAVKPSQGQDDTPLFPGYLFVHLGPEQSEWPTFRPGHRILGWLNFEGEIPWVPDSVISELKERTEGINSTGGLWTQFQTGETVEVVSPGLNGLAEVLEKPKSPQGRATVLIEFMGRMVKAQVPWENLKSASAPRSGRNRPGIGHAPRRTRGKGRRTAQFRTPALGYN